MDVMNVIDKTCNAIRRKIAAFVNSISPKELVEIGEDTYYEESIIERDGRKYVLLRSIEDPSAIQVRRICEYYETVEDETELRYAVKELMGQQAFTKKRSRNRRFVFDIAMFVLTAVAIMGNSWFIRYYEASVFEHEMICYSLLAVCVCIIYNRACMTKPSAVSACLSFGFAILFTLLVFLLNNWWRYLYENTRFYWNFQNGWYWPFSAILKSDIKYSIGIGKYRYWLSFFAAEIGLLVEMAFMREVLKKNKLLI